MTSEETKRVDEVIESLSEHFDTVQIFVTDHADCSTTSYSHGKGNWYARRGQIATWMEVNRETDRIKVRREED